VSSVRHLTATTYHRKMGSGRTKPMLFSCEDDEGNAAGELVVKLKDGVNNGVTGLTCELLGSLVAEFLGIATPEPALIDLDASFAEALRAGDADVAEIIRKSSGVNFGTRLLSGGYRTWPVDMAIPSSLRPVAAEIFAFDALIQNPDRRYDNPNILFRDEEIFVIDHESAFSFVYAIGAPNQPWNIEGAAFLENHVFYRGLRGGKVDTERFVGALGALSDEVVTGLADKVPAEWKSEHLTKILEHLRSAGKHATEFGQHVKRRLV
jgi:hypothetical protein